MATDNIRDEDNPDPRPLLLKFLKANDATFTNVLLDEPITTITGKLRVENLPCAYIFDRQGKWRRLIGDTLVDDKGEVRHADIEAMIDKLLE